MGDEFRADSFKIKSIADKIDQNGYLRIKATFTRGGIFEYPQPDGSTRRELRHPDDVTRADSVNTLKLIPVASVFDHALTALNLQNPDDSEKIKSIGVTGENIEITSDKCLDGSLTIYDKKTISDLIEAEKSDSLLPHVSAAYRVRGGLDNTPGTFEGKAYDARQLPPFIYGHVTLVAEGRAGSRCQIRADSAGDISNKEDGKKMTKTIKEIPALKIGSGENVFRADALEIEETPGTLKLLARAIKLATALKKEQTRADTIDGEFSVLKADKDKLDEKIKKMIPDEQFRADLKESVELMKMAEEAGIKMDDDFDLTPKGLKMAICLQDNPDMDKNRTDTSQGYLDGLFSGIKGDWKQRLSKNKTLRGLEFHKNNEQPVSETEYEDYENF